MKPFKLSLRDEEKDKLYETKMSKTVISFLLILLIRQKKMNINVHMLINLFKTDLKFIN